jgi:hypothetical protein
LRSFVQRVFHRPSVCGADGGRALASTVALLGLAFGLAPDAGAVPITYMLQVYGGNATGTLGATPFSNAKLVFTFDGDTSNVIPFSAVGANGATTTGYENLLGTATVTIYDGSGAVLTATFLPAAGIYVSVDNTNGGVGFGSHGVPPTNPAFPGEPAYPSGMLSNNVATYDLTGYFDTGPGFAISCVGFAVTATCQTPFALPTTAGDLILNPVNISSSIFNSFENPVTAFSAFQVRAIVLGSNTFYLSGSFTLGGGSNGINPVAEAVTLAFGPYSVALPPGAFRKDRYGNFDFLGTISGVGLAAQISPQSDGSYRFYVVATRANLTGIANPVAVALTIGDDSGSTSVEASFPRRDR